MGYESELQIPDLKMNSLATSFDKKPSPCSHHRVRYIYVRSLRFGSSSTRYTYSSIPFMVCGCRPFLMIMWSAVTLEHRCHASVVIDRILIINAKHSISNIVSAGMNANCSLYEQNKMSSRVLSPRRNE